MGTLYAIRVRRNPSLGHNSKELSIDTPLTGQNFGVGMRQLRWRVEAKREFNRGIHRPAVQCGGLVAPCQPVRRPGHSCGIGPRVAEIITRLLAAEKICKHCQQQTVHHYLMQRVEGA